MRDAVYVLLLVFGAGAEQDPQRRRLGIGHRSHHRPKPVLKRLFLEMHGGIVTASAPNFQLFWKRQLC